MEDAENARMPSTSPQVGLLVALSLFAISALFPVLCPSGVVIDQLENRGKVRPTNQGERGRAFGWAPLSRAGNSGVLTTVLVVPGPTQRHLPAAHTRHRAKDDSRRRHRKGRNEKRRKQDAKKTKRKRNKAWAHGNKLQATRARHKLTTALAPALQTHTRTAYPRLGPGLSIFCLHLVSMLLSPVFPSLFSVCSVSRCSHSILCFFLASYLFGHFSAHHRHQHHPLAWTRRCAPALASVVDRCIEQALSFSALHSVFWRSSTRGNIFIFACHILLAPPFSFLLSPQTPSCTNPVLSPQLG